MVALFFISSVIFFASVQCVEARSPYVLDKLTSLSLFSSRQDFTAQRVEVSEDKIKFILFTRQYPDGYRLIRDDLDNLRDSGFNNSNPTKVITHGLVNNYTSDSVQIPKNAYISKGDYNVIGVDWSYYGFPYLTAVSSAKPVGLLTGGLVAYLMEKADLVLEDLHFIGHSMGAHIVSFAAERLGLLPPRITGLDPADPAFGNFEPNYRLGSEDALFVDVIHTSVGLLGMTKRVGHADFYPAGGKHQPGCSTNLWEEAIGFCDHARSYIYFAQSIRDESLFPAFKCKSVNEALAKKCRQKSKVFMGEAARRGFPEGVYYVDEKTLVRKKYSGK